MLKNLSVSVVVMVVSLATQAVEQLIPTPPQLAATSYLLIDADTGAVLVEYNSEEQLPPASLTKMMTSYIVSAEVERQRISEDDLVNISVKAWRMGGSKMFVREGTQVLLKDLQRGVIIQSGNDASIALAEHLAGSEEVFVDLMNKKAAQMGLTKTHFANATGWPAEGHLTTAKDLSILARAVIRDYPRHYSLYAEKSFSYSGITQPNRNRLLFRDDTFDGLKTGHTEEAGYCLIASAKRNGMRLISVVMGTKSEEARAEETQKLMTYGFRYFQALPIYSSDETLKIGQVWYGISQEVKLGVGQNVVLTLPIGSEKKLQTNMQIDDIISAPIALGQKLGKIIIELDGEILVDMPLIALHEVEQGGFFARLVDRVKLFFRE